MLPGITPAISDMIGCVFNRWTVTGYGGRDSRGKPLVFVRCSCGNSPEKPIDASNVKGGRSKSCGCLHRELVVVRNTTHGLTGDPTLQRCRNAWRRCYDEKLEYYPHYGGNPTDPVRLAPEWENDLVAMREYLVSTIGKCPGVDHFIDRIGYTDSEGKWRGGNYEPGNLRWATESQSVQNRGMLSTNTSGVKGVRIGRDGYVYGKVTSRGREWHKNFGLYTAETWDRAVEEVRSRREKMHAEYANHG